MNAPSKSALLMYTADLRDDARSVAIAQPMEELLGPGQNPWLELAADLAQLTSALVGDYVDGLDPETKRIVELTFAQSVSGGGR